MDGWTTFCLSVHQLVDIWVVSTFGIVNNAAVNIQVQIFVCFHLSRVDTKA